MPRRSLIAAALVALAAAPLAAQSAATIPPELGIFSKLIGTWEGEAWYQMGPGGRQQVKQMEWVEPVAGGTVMTVKGLGTMTTADGGTSTVHDAFAVIHLDHDGKTPMLRAFTAQGHWMDMDITVRSDGYSWAMTDPRAGKIRYDMSLGTDGRWVEKGYRQAGEEWVQFMEMVLTRK